MLDLSRVPDIEYSALKALQESDKKMAEQGVTLWLAGCNPGVLEVVRSFSSAYFPNTWQLVLGLFLLFVIRFLPKGIGSLWMRGDTR